MDVAAAVRLQERERVRIGFDLHDGLAQTLSAALLQIRMLQDAEDSDTRLGLTELRSTLSSALDELYELIDRLGGRESTDDDLAIRVRSCVDRFASRSRIGARLTIEGTNEAVSPSLTIAVARIVQEALSNVHRHSEATRVDVLLRLLPDSVRCEISDDGKGFDAHEVQARQRGRQPFGLHSMRERARLLDGNVVIDSIPGAGTRVRAEIPVWRA